MLTSKYLSRSLPKIGCMTFSATAFLCTVILEFTKGELLFERETSEILDGQVFESNRKPTLHNLGAFFHVQHSWQIKKAFLKYNVIPDLIEKAPKNVLRVQFVRGRDSAKFGNVLNPRDLHCKPKIIYWPANDDESFSLFVMDPDKEHQRNTSWLYWYVVNIHGSKVRTGFEVARYMFPNPSRGTGLHRIVYLVYKQPLGDLFFYDQMYLNETRSNFTLENILRKYRFDNRPVAGNFFQTQWFRPRKTRRPNIMTTTTEGWHGDKKR